MASPGAVEVENAAVDWLRQIVGLGDRAWGTLQSGGSLATLTAVVAARETRPPADWPRSVIYATEEAHHCIRKAFHTAGLAGLPLRLVPVDDELRMRSDRLERQIAADRADGLSPWIVVASAGTINTGAVDPLEASRRVEEIAYLVNVLCSGSTFRDGRFSPDQALRAAMATCGLGLELLVQRAPEAWSPALRLPADVLFRIGWGELHRRVRVPARRLLRRAEPGSDVEAVATGLAEPCPLFEGEEPIGSVAALERAEAWLGGTQI